MHTYDSSIYGNWFNYEDTLGNDDSLAEGTCNQALAMTGDFTVRLGEISQQEKSHTRVFYCSIFFLILSTILMNPTTYMSQLTVMLKAQR